MTIEQGAQQLSPGVFVMPEATHAAIVQFTEVARQARYGRVLEADLPGDHAYFPGAHILLQPYYGDRGAAGQGAYLGLRITVPGIADPSLDAHVHHLDKVGYFDKGTGKALENSGLFYGMRARGQRGRLEPATPEQMEEGLSVLNLLPNQVVYSEPARSWTGRLTGLLSSLGIKQ